MDAAWTAELAAPARATRSAAAHERMSDEHGDILIASPTGEAETRRLGDGRVPVIVGQDDRRLVVARIKRRSAGHRDDDEPINT